jgi:hypothetical protein
MKAIIRQLTLATLIAICGASVACASDTVSRSGTMTLKGCAVTSKDTELTASPITQFGTGSSQPSTGKNSKGASDKQGEAHIDPTNDPHVFQFVFHGLADSQLYSLGVQVTQGL